MSTHSRLAGLIAFVILMGAWFEPGLVALAISGAAGVTPVSDSTEALALCPAKADYRFQNTLNTSVEAAPALSNLGAGNSFVNTNVEGTTRAVLRFPTNGGLVLDPTSRVVSAQVYTIVLLFSFDEVGSYRRILDFKHGTDDAGLYVFSGQLAFYPVNVGQGAVIAPNTFVQVVITRDAAKNFTGYVNGVQRLSFVDSTDRAVIDSFNQLRFFRDNESGGPTDESSAGAVARIRLYDCAFTGAEVSALDRLPPPPAAGCPIVHSFNPTVAASGTQIIITGSNLTGVSAVRFSPNVNASSLSINNPSTQLGAIVPSGATNGPLTIVKPGCADTITAHFTFIRPLTCVSAASFQPDISVAAESVISCFSTGFVDANSVAVAQTVPLPLTLLGTSVNVRDSGGTNRSLGLFFVSPTQINGHIPKGTVNGLATMTATNNDGTMFRGELMIATVAPGIFTANTNGFGEPAAYVIRVKPGNIQTQEEVVQLNATFTGFVLKPIDFGPETDQLFLVLYGTGWRFRSALANVSLAIGGINVPVVFAGDQVFLVGLDQLNAILPRTLIGRGTVNITLTFDGIPANTLLLNFK